MSVSDQAERTASYKKSGRARRLRLPSLGLKVSERKLLLVIVDVILISSALILSLTLRTDLLPDINAFLLNLKWFATLIILWAIISSIFGLYDLALAANQLNGLLFAFGSAALTSGIYLTIPWLTPPILNRTQAFLFVLIAIGSISLWRGLYATLFVQPAFARKTLIVGAGNSARSLVKALARSNVEKEPLTFNVTGHDIIGFVDDDPLKADTSIDGIPVLGSSSSLVNLVYDLAVDEVVVAITNTQDIKSALFEAILDCRERGIPVVTMMTLYERLTGRVAFEHASQNVELASGQVESGWSRFYIVIKRLADIGGALMGLVPLLVVTPIVYLINLFFSPGPLFFYQNRVGIGGRIFQLVKFRSMIPDAERDTGAVWAAEWDGRITPVGNFLRRTHIDELPQVMNVLKGEMSLVGPRPERPEFVDHLSHQIPFYRARHSMKPGITGWAQIHQNYGDSIEGAKEKLEYDLFYVKHAGPSLDTIILLRTITKVIGLKGR